MKTTLVTTYVSMIDQQKILRVFKLISLLERGRSLVELSEKLEISERTCHRYLRLLNELGFEIQLSDKRYSIKKSQVPFPATFTDEELDLIATLTSALPAQHPLKNSLLEKININNPNERLLQNYYNLKTALMVDQLQDAIHDKKQVKLLQYQSAHSGTVSDRIVEPKLLSKDYITLKAVEVSSQELKHFKIDRIAALEILNTTQKNTQLTDDISDAFGMTGELMQVKFSMNLRSKLLLEEEYPDSREHIKALGDVFVFDGPVRHYKGVARFVLSLLDEVSVLEPEDFKHYLNEKVKKIGF